MNRFMDGKKTLLRIANRHIPSGDSYCEPNTGVGKILDKQSCVAVILRLVTPGSTAAGSMQGAVDSSAPAAAAAAAFPGRGANVQQATLDDIKEMCASDDAPAQLQLLLIRRAVMEGNRWSGDLALPGGHVDPGETMLEACVREVREEIGLRLDVGGSGGVGGSSGGGGTAGGQFLLLGQGDTMPVFERRATVKRRRSSRQQLQLQQQQRQGNEEELDNFDSGASQDSELVYKHLVLGHFIFVLRGLNAPLPPLTLSEAEVSACAWVDVEQIRAPGRALVPLRWLPTLPADVSIWDKWRFHFFKSLGLMEMFFPSCVLMPSAATCPLPTPSQWLARIQSCSRYPRINITTTEEEEAENCSDEESASTKDVLQGCANHFRSEQWVLWGLTLTLLVECLHRSGVGGLPPRYIVYSRSNRKDCIATTLYPSRFSPTWVKSKL